MAVKEIHQEDMFLHNSESLGVVLISAPLDGAKYLTCRCAMKIALEAKGKMEFTVCRCQTPYESTAEYR